MRVLLAVAILVVAVVAAPQVAAITSRSSISVEDSLGAFHADCLPTHDAMDDPIVFPNKPGASHLHAFFGNRSTDARATNGTLRRHRATSCMRDDEEKGAPGPADSSGYWVPALYVG